MADKIKIYNMPILDQDKAAFLIMCTAQEIQNRIAGLIHEHDISMTQLTILHILDELPVDKVKVKTIREMMVEDSPNVSRALNKLASKKLIYKERSEEDQRVVHVTISKAGREMHRICDKKITGSLLSLSKKEAGDLVDLLMKT